MYKTTTIFNKAQTPGISRPVLLELYKQELEFQEVSNIEVSNGYLIFSIDTFKIFWLMDANKFSNFKSGQITIEETDQKYIVTLSADTNRILNKAGVITVLVIMVMLFCGVFNGYSMFFGLFVFLVALGIMYIRTGLFFSVYFDALRRKIENVLQNNTIYE
jgi:hypothetical protein